MAAIDLPNKKNRHASIRINRRSTRVDLTPMVDLGFLLITFFVFTTTMTERKVLDLQEPVEDSSKPVAASGAMTIIPAKDHQIYYYYGEFNKNQPFPIARTNFKTLRRLIVKKKLETDSAKLMFVIKAADKATFRDYVAILDEMAICNVKPGHYAEVEISKEESGLLK